MRQLDSHSGPGPWVARVESAPAFREVVDHPYLRKFEQGELPPGHVAQTWLVQQAWLSRSFGHCMASLLGKLGAYPNVNGLDALSDVVHEEIWRQSGRGGHHSLFVGMAAALDPQTDCANLPPAQPCTIAFIEQRQQAIERSSPAFALGLLIANEHLNADLQGERGIMVSYAKGLARMQDDPNASAYAEEHVEEERHDVALMCGISEQILKQNSEDPDFQSEFVMEFDRGASFICDRRVEFFDGLMQLS
jgi:hypothetical protein